MKSEIPSKFIIQSVDTGLYMIFAGEVSWVPSPKQARKFFSSYSAKQFANTRVDVDFRCVKFEQEAQAA